jgi:hypothetical protein
LIKLLAEILTSTDITCISGISLPAAKQLGNHSTLAPLIDPSENQLLVSLALQKRVRKQNNLPSALSA